MALAQRITVRDGFALSKVVCGSNKTNPFSGGSHHPRLVSRKIETNPGGTALISERQLADLFDSFWQQHFPLLNSSFVRRFNAEKQQRVTDMNGNPMLPVPMGDGVQRFDLVAELAFEMAIERHKISRGEKADFAVATQHALDKIAVLKGEAFIPKPSEREVAETERLLNVYDKFFALLSPVNVFFKPTIMGAGILDEMEGDFCTSETLFEVKAVNRNLQSSDLRQVICYLIAGLGSRRYVWSEYCIFNPRLAVYYYGRIDELLAYISGRTPHECIASVLDALMEREQPLEARF